MIHHSNSTPRVMYVVVVHYNDYDQHGGYFDSVHTSREEAEAYLNENDMADGSYIAYDIVEATTNPHRTEGRS